MTHPLGLALAALAAATAPIPTTDVYDGMPPPRFRGDTAAFVRFSNPNTPSACGIAPPKLKFEACVRQGVILMPNPCPYGDTETYARLMCHEMAHTNLWPSTHGP